MSIIVAPMPAFPFGTPQAPTSVGCATSALHSVYGPGYAAPQRLPPNTPLLALREVPTQVPIANIQWQARRDVPAKVAPPRTPSTVFREVPGDARGMKRLAHVVQKQRDPSRSPRVVPREACATRSVQVHASAEGRATRQPFESSEQRKFLCYGDSLTAGFYAGGTRFTPYGQALSEALGSIGIDCEVSFCGLSGLTAQTMSLNTDVQSGVMVDISRKTGRGLGTILKEDAPKDLVLIMAGTNDMPNASAAVIFESIRSLHSVCHVRGIRTMALAPPVPPQGDRTKRLQLLELLKDWAHVEPSVLAYVDPEELVPRNAARAFWDADTIHFSPAGSCALGQGLAQIIHRIICDTGKPSLSSLAEARPQVPSAADPPASSTDSPTKPVADGAESFSPFSSLRRLFLRSVARGSRI